MFQFHYQQGIAGKLALFPHILELCIKKNTSIQLHSFTEKVAEGLCVFFIHEGRFEWILNEQRHCLFPGDAAIILPGQRFGNEKGILELGTILNIEVKINWHNNGELLLDDWSQLNEAETTAIGKLLGLNSNPLLSKLHDSGRILGCISHEIHHLELGYGTRINQLIDELLITITRHLTRQNNPSRDFPKMFLKLEESLRKDLSHQWTVEEMAAIAGMGSTLFNEKVKNFTGFTPINYLINIRISEAIRLLKKKEISITDIALDTGFYSSQHFSTTFKKLTGYTPGEFRKNNLSTE
ncbi:MAG: AraC family transcriptional regulator [Sphingobacteriales bacterium]|nr:MAG: AraC family transcriptional regulator [Sphingobacteriales bacterium]